MSFFKKGRLSFVMGELRDCILQYNTGQVYRPERRITIRDYIIEGRKLDRVDPIWKKLLKASAPFDYEKLLEITKCFKGNRKS